MPTFIENLKSPLGGIRTFALSASDLKEDDGALIACNDPSIAPFYFGFEIWPGLEKSGIEQYCRRFEVEIPDSYIDILHQANGVKLGKLNLYGIPISMLKEPPLLNRSIRQPLDIGTANLHWRKSFKDFSSKFHFGGIKWTFSENAGVFLDDSGIIVAVLKTGEVVQEFENYEKLLEFWLRGLGQSKS